MWTARRTRIEHPVFTLAKTPSVESPSPGEVTSPAICEYTQVKDRLSADIRDAERRSFRFVLPIDSHHTSDVMVRNPLFMYINECTLARNRTLASTRAVARHLATLVALQDIAALTQGSALISAKTRNVRRRLPVEPRSRNTCERTIRHGNLIRQCTCPL